MKIQSPNSELHLSELEQNEDDIRTFVFEREETHQSLIKDIKMTTNSQSVDLSALFAEFCPLEENKVSIYDPELNKFMELARFRAQVTGILPRNLLQTKIILIRFKKRDDDSESHETDSGVESGLESSRQKKDRSKERTIGQAIELVKKWRLIHLDNSKLGLKRMSLSDAAKAIGVSKKSLDDYYYQLRLGQFYNFDFTNNLNQKVGILRAYVKEFKPEKEQKNKNLRHPRHLKIIQSFDLDLPKILKEEIIANTPSSHLFQELRSPNSMKSLSLDEDSSQCLDMDGNPFLKDVMTSYQDKFFKNFQFLLDDPNDPFIQIEHNFKKKPYQQSNNDFFFF